MSKKKKQKKAARIAAAKKQQKAGTNVAVLNNPPVTESPDELKKDVAHVHNAEKTISAVNADVKTSATRRRAFLYIAAACGMLIVALMIGYAIGARYNDALIAVMSQKTEAEPKLSEFRKKLDSVMAQIGQENGVTYCIEEHYYDEKRIEDYISIISEIPASEIDEEHIKNLFSKIFIPILRDDNTYGLICKSCAALVDECENKTKMNSLDYLYFGGMTDAIREHTKGMYISQNNPDFENMAYGSSNIKLSGCGPVSLTIALNYIAGEKITTLEEVVSWANSKGMYTKNAGTKWSLMRDYPERVSMEVDEVYVVDEERLRKLLGEGKLLVTTMKQGSFTDNGHFLIIIDCDSNGMVSVIDCASIRRSLRKWDVNLILEESNDYFWAIYK